MLFLLILTYCGIKTGDHPFFDFIINCYISFTAVKITMLQACLFANKVRGSADGCVDHIFISTGVNTTDPAKRTLAPSRTLGA